MKNKQIILTISIIILTIITAIIIISNYSQTKEGSLTKITYEELTEKLNNKEDLILIVSQSTCSHCASYKPKVEQIAKEYGITAYYIDFDKLSNSKEFLTEFNLSGASPITLFFENGQEKSVLNRIEGDLSNKIIIEKFKKMGFIEE